MGSGRLRCLVSGSLQIEMFQGGFPGACGVAVLGPVSTINCSIA